MGSHPPVQAAQAPQANGADISEFNAHQQDLRNRVSSLAQAFFVLAAGTLSLSITTFTGSKAIKLQGHDGLILQLSWWGLVLSIVSLALMLCTIVTRDYFFGERWRAAIENRGEEPGPILWVECLIIGLGLIGVLLFISGFLGLAAVATSIIGN